MPTTTLRSPSDMENLHTHTIVVLFQARLFVVVFKHQNEQVESKLHTRRSLGSFMGAAIKKVLPKKKFVRNEQDNLSVKILGGFVEFAEAQHECFALALCALEAETKNNQTNQGGSTPQCDLVVALRTCPRPLASRTK
eukprot:3847662-Amphidinium_carterae.1